MKFYNLPFRNINNKILFLNPFTGNLLVSLNELDTDDVSDVLPLKILCAYRLCASPYLLDPSPVIPELAVVKPSVTHIAKKIIKLVNINFLLARFYTAIQRPAFSSAEESISNFRAIIPTNQNDLCLSRSFFAAKTSAAFDKKGVLFIGVFLPSRSMHAWVIEDGAQSDPHDDIWINYRPIAAIG
jgi:hypothetical protein